MTSPPDKPADGSFDVAEQKTSPQSLWSLEDKKPAADPQPSGPAHSTWRPPDYPQPVTLTEDGPVTDESNEQISTTVAARGVRIGIASGWLVGIGSGLGIGAVLTAAVSKITRR